MIAHRVWHSPQTVARFTLCASIAVLLTACGSSPRAPVESRSIGSGGATIVSAPRVDPATLPGYQFMGKPGYYTVQPGDTMYSVARNQGQSFNNIAAWNSQWVPNPSALEVGQVLRVAPPAGFVAAAATPAPRTTATTHTAAPAEDAEETQAAAPARKPATPAVAATGSFNPQWPVQSHTIIAPYDGRRSKGIAIAGKEGDQVVAAESGRAIAAEPMRGYGNLIVLQHSGGFLTVYGHNRKLLIKNGQTVRKGQAIAELGKEDTDRPKLYFEIRQSNESRNPMNYLR